MRGHVTSRGPLGKPDKNGKRHHEGPPYTVSIEEGELPARRCPGPTCVDKRGGRRLYWLDKEPPTKCPKCHGELEAARPRISLGLSAQRV